MASIVIKCDTSGSVTISAPSVAGTQTLNLQAASGTLATTAQASVGTKNLIINGDMTIAQRGTSSTGQSNVGGGYRTVDRFAWQLSASMGTWTQEQSTDAPEGFSYSLKHTCTSTATIGANNDAHQIYQKIEGQNLQHLNYGTSNAQSITASFWVKSNLTGVYTVSLYGNNGSSTRQIGSTITINSANTWEKKTVTIVGDTVNILQNNNGQGLNLAIWLACGTNRYSSGFDTSWVNYNALTAASPSQTQLGTTISDYFNITGVQLEIGENATPFEHRMYSQELAMCQRYYYVLAEGDNQAIAVGYYYNATQLGVVGTHPVQMRATPTVDQTTGTNYYSISRDNNNDPFDSFSVAGSTNNKNYYLFNNTQVSGTAGQAGIVYNYTTSGGNAYVALSAEL